MANYLTNNTPQRPQWLRLILLLILFTLLLFTLTSCHTTRTTTHHQTTTADTIYQYINTAHHAQTLHTDTLHDSIYIREVVTQQGQPIYKERIVYRNHTGQTTIHTNTTADTTQTAQHHQTTNNQTTTKTTPPPINPRTPHHTPTLTPCIRSKNIQKKSIEKQQYKELKTCIIQIIIVSLYCL